MKYMKVGIFALCSILVSSSSMATITGPRQEKIATIIEQEYAEWGISGWAEDVRDAAPTGVTIRIAESTMDERPEMIPYVTSRIVNKLVSKKLINDSYGIMVLLAHTRTAYGTSTADNRKLYSILEPIRRKSTKNKDVSAFRKFEEISQLWLSRKTIDLVQWGEQRNLGLKWKDDQQSDVEKDQIKATKTAVAIYKENGMSGLMSATDICYKNNEINKFYCLYFDLASRHIDQLMVEGAKLNGYEFPTTEYFEDEAFGQRVGVVFLKEKWDMGKSNKYLHDLTPGINRLVDDIYINK